MKTKTKRVSQPKESEDEDDLPVGDDVEVPEEEPFEDFDEEDFDDDFDDDFEEEWKKSTISNPMTMGWSKPTMTTRTWMNSMVNYPMESMIKRGPYVSSC